MKNFLISIKITFAFCVIFFVSYVLVLWALAAVVSPNSGKAVVLTSDGTVVGAQNVGQVFTSIDYFWSRPSVVDYDGSGSGGSNKGINNPDYITEVEARIDTFLVAHPYLNRSKVPSEMVTASGSGLDPHISVAAANVQIQRVAEARGIGQNNVKQLVDSLTENPFIGVPVINVLMLNIALDEKYNN